MKKIKGIIFISNVQKALEHEWFCESVDKNEFDLEFVLFNSENSDLFSFISGKGFKCTNYFLKSKFFIPFYIFFFFVKMIFKRYHFVHCHLFEASLIGLIAGKLAGIRRRIYTRHHSDFHHVYFPNAVKYDLLINRCSTHIIAVSDVVRKILIEQEQVKESKVSTIEHAVNLEMFKKENIDLERIKAMKCKYKISSQAKVVGVVSRFTIWKGVQYIIPAFKKYLAIYPNSVLVLANANGEYKSQILELLKDLPEKSYRLISFEADSATLFQLFDFFVHVPMSPSVEAFGQVYIEALASSVPCIFTKSGIGNRILKDGHNSLIVEYSDSETIWNALLKLTKDNELASTIVSNGLETVTENFSIERKNQSIFNLYRTL
ncbi:MAG: glycosyltransferase family 4 protein [Bacteroidota bacterium]